MTGETAGPAARLNPWLSAPFRPRTTIRQVAASTSTPAFLALCAAIGASNALWFLANPLNSLRDWRLIVLLVAVCAPLALMSVYAVAALIRFASGLMGSAARGEQIRNALAWGAVPLLWGALVPALLLVPRRWTDNTLLAGAVDVSAGVAAIWSFAVTTLMLMEVLRLGAVRALACYVGAILFTALFLALAVRTFLWQPFSIPSVAQAPALIPGDHIFVSKYAYGYSRYSLPFGLVPFKGRAFANEPGRGDIVVFKLPRDNRTDYVKRIVGLPGETILLRHGVVHIDGTPVPRRRVEDYPMRDRGQLRTFSQYEETLPNGVAYRVLDAEPDGPLDNAGPFQVPPGQYFVMGDNRDNSVDSRMPLEVGYVPFENLIGRAGIVFMSISEDGSSRTERLLTRVR